MPSKLSAIFTSLCLFLTVGCAERSPDEIDPAVSAARSSVVEITARGLEFEAPDSVASGWLTFRFNNLSEMAHFALIEQLPEGKGVEAQQTEVAPVFQAGMDLLNAGKVDSAMAKFGELPEWYGGVQFLGGPGLLSPGRMAETTLHLEPGTYVLECYVKTGGIFHSYNPVDTLYGMVREFTVTEDTSTGTRPEPSVLVMISSERGIEMAEEPAAGEQVVAVRFEDQIVHENFVGHDVHLVRLEDETDVDSLADWLDWSRPGGLETPAPVELLGGTNEMPAGSTAYLSVDFEPGRYAWVSEVANSAEKGMIVEFTVGI